MSKPAGQVVIEDDLEGSLEYLKAELYHLKRQLERVDNEIGVLITHVKLIELESLINEINRKIESLSSSLMIKALYIKFITLNCFLFHSIPDSKTDLVRRSLFNFNLVRPEKVKFISDQEVDVITNALSTYYCSLFVASMTYSLMSLFINQRSSVMMGLAETAVFGGLINHISTWRGKTRILYLHFISVLVRSYQIIPEISVELSYFCCVSLLAGAQFLISFRNIYGLKLQYQASIAGSKKLYQIFGSRLAHDGRVTQPTGMDEIIHKLFNLYQDRGAISHSVDDNTQRADEILLKQYEKKKEELSQQRVQELLALDKKERANQPNTRQSKVTKSKKNTSVDAMIDLTDDDVHHETKQQDSPIQSNSFHIQSFYSWQEDGRLSKNSYKVIDDEISKLCDSLNEIDGLELKAYRTGSTVSANRSEHPSQNDTRCRDVDYLLICNHDFNLLENRNVIRSRMMDLHKGLTQINLKVRWPQYENNLIRDRAESSDFVYYWKCNFEEVSIDVTIRSPLNFKPPISTVRAVSLDSDHEIGRFSTFPSDELHVMLSRCVTDRDWLIVIKKIYVEYLGKGNLFMNEKWSLGKRCCLGDILLAIAKLSKGLSQDTIKSYIEALTSEFVQRNCDRAFVGDGIDLGSFFMYVSDLMKVDLATKLFNAEYRNEKRENMIYSANSGFR